MRRLTDFFKSLASPNDDKIKTPSFVKKDNLPAPPYSAAKVVAVPVFIPEDDFLSSLNSNQKVESQTRNLSEIISTDKIDVPVYENDSEWDVVQRSINLFADNAHLSDEVKQAFVKKWVAELTKAEQTMLYRNDEGDKGHLGNKVNRSAADSTTGLLGTYQAMIDPGRQARMMDELKALRCIEEFNFGIVNAHLCREVKSDLINTVIGTIEEQKTAAQKLIQRAGKGHPEADRIYSSTKELANCREMRLNAAIKTATLNMDAAKYQQLGLQSVESNDQVQIISPMSVQASSNQKIGLRNGANQETVKSRISESAWVDEQAQKLLGNI